MYAEQLTLVVETLFLEPQAPAEGSLALQELRSQFTTQSAADDGEFPVAEFDELAYTSEIRRQLISTQSLPRIGARQPCKRACGKHQNHDSGTR